MLSAIDRAFRESIAAKTQFLKEYRAALAGVVDVIATRLLAGNKVLFFGNGGSAADAQHLAAEFVNRFLLERPPLPAIALTTDTSTLTSIANDYGYDEVFAKQVKASVAKATWPSLSRRAGTRRTCCVRSRPARRPASSRSDSPAGTAASSRQIVDHHLRVSASRLSPRIQETHILVGHVICELVDCKLFGRDPRKRRRLKPRAIDLSRVRTVPLAARPSKVVAQALGRPLRGRGVGADLLASLPDSSRRATCVRQRASSHARRRAGGAIVLGMGAHPIKVGLSPLIVDLIERGRARGGGDERRGPRPRLRARPRPDGRRRTSAEHSSRRHLRHGRGDRRFLNEAARGGADAGIGLGDAVGRTILADGLPHASLSILAAGASRACR